MESTHKFNKEAAPFFDLEGRGCVVDCGRTRQRRKSTGVIEAVSLQGADPLRLPQIPRAGIWRRERRGGGRGVRTDGMGGKIALK